MVKLAGLFLAVVGLLGYGIGKSGLATPFSDPVSHVRAQDETTYASSAAVMATSGGWMTPKLLGRPLLVKPPLLIWLAGISIKSLGISAFALRLPVLLAASFATILLFLWARTQHSLWAACLAAFLLLANPLWHTFARLCYTDMLLAAAMTVALFAVLRDPLLLRRQTWLLVGAAVATGVMSKNIAGLLPIVILVVFYPLRKQHVPWIAILKICAIVAILAGPWHLYQIVNHRRWFWADYVETQLLEFGRNPPEQYSSDGPLFFYLKRLWLTDPLLCVLAAIAMPSLLRVVRGKTEAALLLSWILVSGAALLMFRYRNLPYLLYVIPPLCLLAAGYGPFAEGRSKKIIVSALVLVFVLKVAFGAQSWGLPYGTEPPIPAERWLQWYAKLARPNDLIAVDSDDEFYAMALPIKARFCFIDPSGVTLRYAPHYALLGITVTSSQFQQLNIWEPQFRQRMHEWGLDSTDSIATSIVARSTDEVVQIIEDHPSTDFYIPAGILADLDDNAALNHRVVPASPDRFFLLAMDSTPPADRPASSRDW
jgi:hypothetical protein